MISLPDLLQLLPVLFHRVGLILALVAAVSRLLLVYLFDQEEDQQFGKKVAQISRKVLLGGLAMLVLTGILRLQQTIPRLFHMKLVMAVITCGWALGKLADYDKYTDKEFRNNSGVMLLLLLLTAIVGILL